MEHYGPDDYIFRLCNTTLWSVTFWASSRAIESLVGIFSAAYGGISYSRERVRT